MRLRVVLASAISAALMVSGCSSADQSDDVPAESTSTSESTATSTTTESETTAEGPPPMPPEAQQDGEAGAVAFVEHWVELVNYALRTGDSARAADLTTQCEVCEVVLDAAVDTADPSTTSFWGVTRAEAVPQSSELPDADAHVVLGIAIPSTASDEFGELRAALQRQGGRWTIRWLSLEEF